VDTIVIMMGLSRINVISKKLIEGGMDRNMPVAVIQDGTTSKQKIVKGTISNISNKIKRNKIKPPTNIIIGQVVELSDIIGWKK
jgi:uroporphyrin-III C-methyltransferase